MVGALMFILPLSKDLPGGANHQLFATSNTRVINCDRGKVWNELSGHVRWRKDRDNVRGREMTENSQVP